MGAKVGKMLNRRRTTKNKQSAGATQASDGTDPQVGSETPANDQASSPPEAASGLLGHIGDAMKVASTLSDKMTENKTVIAETVVTQVSKALPQLNLTDEKKTTVTKTVETVIEKASEKLKEQESGKAESLISKSTESNEPVIEQKSTEVIEAPKKAQKTELLPSSITGLLAHGGDTLNMASSVVEKVTENKTVIAETVVTQVSKVLPQLNLTEEKKTTVTKTVETAIEKAGEMVKSKVEEQRKEEAKNQEPIHPHPNEPKESEGAKIDSGFLDSTKVAEEIEKLVADEPSKDTDAIVSETSDVNADDKTETDATQRAAEDASKPTTGGKAGSKKKRRKNKNSNAQGANSGSEPTSPENLGDKLDALAAEVDGAKSCSIKGKNSDVKANGEENGHNTEENDALDDSVPNSGLEVTSS